MSRFFQRPGRGQPSESMLLGVLLTLAGGFQDAYSYNCRSQVFANAQTGNIVLLGQSLAQGNFPGAVRYLIPLAAFLAGVYLSQWVRHLWQERGLLHWRQIVVLFEIIMLAAAGFLPQQYNTLANVMLSFACAMQVDSFRKFHGISCATTMCIGNMRSAAENLSQYHMTRQREYRTKAAWYGFIILAFAVGAAIGAVLTLSVGERAIWVAAGLLLAGFALMFRRAEGEPTVPDGVCEPPDGD